MRQKYFLLRLGSGVALKFTVSLKLNRRRILQKIPHISDKVKTSRLSMTYLGKPGNVRNHFTIIVDKQFFGFNFQW